MSPAPERPTPSGWPRVAPSVFYDDAPTAIDFLTRAFGFEVRLRCDGEEGRVDHAELTYGDGLVMLATGGALDGRPGGELLRSPRTLGGVNTQSLCVFVDDVDAHCETARAAGAQIETEPFTQDYGEDYWADRSYLALDPEGHRWWFLQRMRG